MADVKLQDKYQLFIGGQWRDASDGKTFTTSNPATGATLAQCAEATKEDVDAAVAAAWKAFESWKKVPVNERAVILNKIADIIDANAELLATVETLDNGKPIRETLNVDVPLSSQHFRYFAGCIMAEEGSANILGTDTLSLILREPIGVVGQIVPWNFPFCMAAWKLAPVLAAGCCTVLKPSSTTSLSVLVFAQLIQDVVPPGVINIITGSGARSGQFMLEHKGFRKLAFTGSTEVGRDIALAAAERLIPATLELGGKSANIFFEDCDFEMAMDGLQMGILFNQGQVCCAGSRVFVQEGIYDKFVAEAVKRFCEEKSLELQDYTGLLANLSGRLSLAGLLETVQGPVKIDCDGRIREYTDGPQALADLKDRCTVTSVGAEGGCVLIGIRISRSEAYAGYEAWVKKHQEETGEEVSYF